MRRRMNAKQAASIRRGVLRVKVNANGHIVVGDIRDDLERRADAVAWQRHLVREGLA